MEPERIIERLKDGDFADDVLRTALLFEDEDQRNLFALARAKRHLHFPDDQAQVRSVIEISNICRQQCLYCAIGGKAQTKNYALDSKTIVTLAEYLYEKGRHTLLLQSGENQDPAFVQNVVDAVTEIRRQHSDLRLILCMGNLGETDYRRLYEAGATDFIIKFETSNAKLFSYCKPRDSLANRLNCIRTLAHIGYRVGSGNIVGLPRQTLDDLIADLKLAHELPLAMNSTTIFVPAENTPFADEPAGNPSRTLNMMALLRIMNPHRLMPTTSSLEKMIPDGQYLGLMAGANTVTIHDGTPEHLHHLFPIYSAKRIRPQFEHFQDILRRAGLKTIATNTATASIGG